MPSRQWVRVLSGKPGRGIIGHVERIWRHNGIDLTVIRFDELYPRDLVAKTAGTFEYVDGTECAVMEMRA
jgi:hypothetical protein